MARIFDDSAGTSPLLQEALQANASNLPNGVLPDTRLIEIAVRAVEQAVHDIFRESEDVPFCRPTDLDALPAAEQVSVRRFEIEQYRHRPELSAAHFCLTSVMALLEITQTLLAKPASPSPQDRERKWKNLAEDAKVAGRAAYRAVLILSDPARAGASAP